MAFLFIMYRKLGTSISVIFHIAILLIPISISFVNQTREVELFVIDEENVPVARKQITSKKTIPDVKKDVEVTTKTPINEIQPVAINQNTDIALPVIEHKEKTFDTNHPQKAQTDNPTKSKKGIDDYEFGSSSGPRFVNRVMPVYPLIARRLGKEGRVLLRLTIDDTGRLTNVEVIENTGYGFTEAAIDAVKSSTFAPANKNGNPVASRVLLPVTFKLK